jgi:hypothetical protein
MFDIRQHLSLAILSTSPFIAIHHSSIQLLLASIAIYHNSFNVTIHRCPSQFYQHRRLSQFYQRCHSSPSIVVLSTLQFHQRHNFVNVVIPSTSQFCQCHHSSPSITIPSDICQRPSPSITILSTSSFVVVRHCFVRHPSTFI